MVDDVLANDITQLMVPQEKSLMPSQAAKGGAFDIIMNRLFGHNRGEGADIVWVVSKSKFTYNEIFDLPCQRQEHEYQCQGVDNI